MYYLKIDSSFIGMESARRYSSVDAGAVSFKVDKDFTKVDTSFSFQEKSYTLSFVPESY